MYTQPLTNAKNILNDVLNGITPLVDIVYLFLPRYKCYYRHVESPDKDVFIRNSYFHSDNLLCVRVENNDDLAFDNFFGTSMCGQLEFSAVLIVKEESDDNLCHRYHENDVIDQYLEEEEEKQTWKLALKDEQQIVPRIGSTIELSFQFDQTNAHHPKTVLWFKTRMQSNFEDRYIMFHLVLGQLFIQLSDNTRIPEPSS